MDYPTPSSSSSSSAASLAEWEVVEHLMDHTGISVSRTARPSHVHPSELFNTACHSYIFRKPLSSLPTDMQPGTPLRRIPNSLAPDGFALVQDLDLQMSWRLPSAAAAHEVSTPRHSWTSFARRFRLAHQFRPEVSCSTCLSADLRRCARSSSRRKLSKQPSRMRLFL